ncbi:MAG TPA: MFS transporter, partial [Microbacterium sp.]|nr:MFS transporter [Microbacterium sp.]
MSHAGEGLTSPLTWAPLASGAALLALFAVVELRGAHPFFPMQLFRNPGFLA